MIRKLYDWVLGWAHHPFGVWALFILAVSESSFFPIPPDVLLIALAIGLPEKSFKYATICSIGSVLGGIIGYVIGLQFMELIGNHIIQLYGLADKFDYIRDLYNRYDALAVAIAGFTPIPYKLFTITAGAFHINFVVFVMASIVSRSARFFLVAGLIYIFGKQIQGFIDKYFNLLSIVFTVLLIGGFVLIRYMF